MAEVESKLHLVDQQSVIVSTAVACHLVCSQIDRPALLNSVMGLLSTLVNVLSKPDKTFSLTAKGTAEIYFCVFQDDSDLFQLQPVSQVDLH